MKTNIKTFLLAILLTFACFNIPSLHADYFDFGYRAPGSYVFDQEGEHTVRVCNNVRCSTTTFRIDKSAPTITTSWLQSEINFETPLEIRAIDNISMIGGSLIVTQDNNKFDIQEALILGKEAIVNITVKPEFVNDLFTTNFTVVAKDHMGFIRTETLGVFTVEYDGVAPIIDVSANNGNQAQAGFFSNIFADNSEDTIRIADGAQESDITDNPGFLVDVNELSNVTNANKQTGIYELAYRYSVDPESYPTELPDSIDESLIKSIGLTASQANAIWQKKDALSTEIQFKAEHKRELLETCQKLGVTETQKTNILALWKNIWKEDFYSVPNKNTALEKITLTEQTKLNTYIQIPETGKILLEIHAVDKAGNIESKIYNIQLDTRPIAQVGPLAWVNPSQGESISVQVFDTLDINSFYTNNTFHYVVFDENKTEKLHLTTNEKLQTLGDELKNLEKGKYILEVYYTNASDFESAKFITTLYIDNSDLVTPENVSYNLGIPTQTTAGISPVTPITKPCTQNSNGIITTKNGIKKTFTNCIPAFEITENSDNKGRSDVVSYNIVQLARMNNGNVETFRDEKNETNSLLKGFSNLLVFDTHNQNIIQSFFEEDLESSTDETATDVLMINTKDAVASKTKNLYEQNIMQDLLTHLSTNESGGTETFAEGIDPVAAQQKTIQNSVTEGFKSVEDSKGKLVVSTTDVRSVSFLTTLAEQKYQKNLEQIKVFLEKNEITEAEIANLKINIQSFEDEINAIQENNTEFLATIQPKKKNLSDLINKVQTLKEAEKSIYAEFIPYMGTEQLLTLTEQKYAQRDNQYAGELWNFEKRTKDLPAIISRDTNTKNEKQSELQNVQSRIQLLSQMNGFIWKIEKALLEQNKSNLESQIQNLSQTINSNQNFLNDIANQKNLLQKTYELDKTTLRNQITQYKKDLEIKKGIEARLKAKQDEITVHVEQIDTLNREITEDENNLLKSINTIGLNELKIEKQKLNIQVQKKEKIVLRNQSFIESAKRNLYSFGRQMEKSAEDISNDIQSIYENLAIPNVVNTLSFTSVFEETTIESTSEETTKSVQENTPLNLTSPVFNNDENIPTKYTCDGQNINPRLIIEQVPENTVSLALALGSDTSPLWTLWNVDPQTYSILENSVPAGAIQGANTRNRPQYQGACAPMSGVQTARFLLYALDTNINLPENASRTEFLSAIEGHVLESSRLGFTFDRSLYIEKQNLETELATLEQNYTEQTTQLNSDLDQINTELKKAKQEKDDIENQLEESYQTKTDLIAEKEEIIIQNANTEENILDTFFNFFSITRSLSDVETDLENIESQIQSQEEIKNNVAIHFSNLQDTKNSIENELQSKKTAYEAEKSRITSAIQTNTEALNKKLESENTQAFFKESSWISFINSILGIDSSYAAGPTLDEGVYELPDGSQLIVDLTAPTGSISGLTENGGNASKDESTGWTFKPGDKQNLALTKNDNFENYGSFQSWKVEGRKGSHPKDMITVCGNYGAYTTIDSSSNYSDPLYGYQVITDNTLATDNVWGDCFEYKLTLSDESGNTTIAASEIIYSDGINPEMGSTPTIKNAEGNEVSSETDPTCLSCELESSWSSSPLTLSWDFTDGQSGIATMKIQVKYNGEIITGLPAILAQDSFTTPADKEGYYEITITATDKAGNEFTKIFVLKYDKTEATLSWNNTSTSGDTNSQLTGSGFWTLGFDDLGNGNSSSSTDKNYVAQITKEDISMSFYKCTSNDCSTSELLTKITGNTVAENTDWVDVVTAIAWNDKDAKNTLENQEVILKHSKFYNDGTNAWEQGGGKYKVIYTLKDRAGNESSLEKVLTVEPNQMSAANSNIIVNSSCSDGSWKADGSDACYISVSGKDLYNNPLYGKTVQMQGFSQTPLDRVHNNDLMYNASDLTQRNTQESIHFESVKNAAAGVQTNTNFTLDNDGLIKINLVTFAPEENGKQIDFYAQYKPHTALNYPEGSGTYSNVKTVTGSNYKTTKQYSFTWVETPAFFSKNATQSLLANVSNLIGANAENERLSLYIYDALTGAYSIDNMNSLPTEAKNTWVFGAENPTAGNLGIVNSSYDAGVIDSALSDNSSGIYTYKVQMTKKAGVQDFDTTVTISPFVRMTIQGKEVAYALSDKLVSNIPLYNQATQTSGSGLIQNNTGNTSQSSGEEAASTANSGISVLAITANVKENVKKEILNLSAASSDGTITAGSDKNGLKASGGVSVINNGNTYILRGDDKNLVISGDITVGSNPIAFVTYGGNIIIRGNIRYAGTVKPTVAIIALQNETTGKGGTIQVANETSSGTAITNILGTLIAERGSVGLGTNASGTETVNLTGEERGNSLTHQLVIDGSIMGGNTLGGGDTPYKCPTFVRVSSCNEDVAQKYDLNYLRRFVPGQTDTHTPASNNDGTTQPVLVRYYLNRELLPEELQ